MQVTYSPAIFDVQNIEQARQIILTAEGSSTDERWESETTYVADLIQKSMSITPDSIFIDYGCGVGRLAKELIKRHGCRVIGVDISENMRALAVGYVQSSRFFACPPEMLDALIDRKFVADSAISVWVLQHSFKPVDDIERIYRSLAPEGNLFVLNNIRRAVPTKEAAWVDDGLNIKTLLSNRLSLREEGTLPEEIIPRGLRGITFWAFFLKPT